MQLLEKLAQLPTMPVLQLAMAHEHQVPFVLERHSNRDAQSLLVQRSGDGNKAKLIGKTARIFLRRHQGKSLAGAGWRVIDLRRLGAEDAK